MSYREPPIVEIITGDQPPPPPYALYDEYSALMQEALLEKRAIIATATDAEDYRLLLNGITAANNWIQEAFEEGDFDTIIELEKKKEIYQMCANTLRRKLSHELEEIFRRKYLRHATFHQVHIDLAVIDKRYRTTGSHHALAA
jgi:hypothetical protein